MALENKFQDKVEFIIVDVDEAQGQQLAQTFSVNSIPAFFLIDRDKNIVEQAIGAKSQADMENLMKSIVK